MKDATLCTLDQEGLGLASRSVKPQKPQKPQGLAGRRAKGANDGPDLRPVGSLGPGEPVMAHHGPSLVSEEGRPGRRRVARIVRGVWPLWCLWSLAVDPHILEFRQKEQDQQAQAWPERPARGQNPDQ